MSDKPFPLLWRIRLWIAGILFLTAGRLVPEIYDGVARRRETSSSGAAPMTDHYSGNDPLRGCGMLIVLLAAFWIVVIVAIALALRGGL